MYTWQIMRHQSLVPGLQYSLDSTFSSCFSYITCLENLDAPRSLRIPKIPQIPQIPKIPDFLSHKTTSFHPETRSTINVTTTRRDQLVFATPMGSRIWRIWIQYIPKTTISKQYPAFANSISLARTSRYRQMVTEKTIWVPSLRVGFQLPIRMKRGPTNIQYKSVFHGI